MIHDLRIKDGITKATGVPCDSYMKSYENFLNDVCKIRFKWKIDKESKEITYRDLTGPEEVRLCQNINIPILFPALCKREQLVRLWNNFFSLINTINNEEFDNIEELRANIKAWVKLFLSIYQRKDVSPYMHACMHRYIYVHAYIHAHIHTYIQTCTNYSHVVLL